MSGIIVLFERGSVRWMPRINNLGRFWIGEEPFYTTREYSFPGAGIRT